MHFQSGESFIMMQQLIGCLCFGLQGDLSTTGDHKAD
jgi:hypothetical protein